MKSCCSSIATAAAVDDGHPRITQHSAQYLILTTHGPLADVVLYAGYRLIPPAPFSPSSSWVSWAQMESCLDKTVVAINSVGLLEEAPCVT